MLMSWVVRGGRQKERAGTYPALLPSTGGLWLRVTTGEEAEGTEVRGDRGERGHSWGLQSPVASQGPQLLPYSFPRMGLSCQRKGPQRVQGPR